MNDFVRVKHSDLLRAISAMDSSASTEFVQHEPQLSTGADRELVKQDFMGSLKHDRGQRNV